MKIALDKKKYNKKAILLVGLTLIQFIVSIVALSMSFVRNENLISDKIIFGVMTLMTGIMFGFILTHYVRLLKHKDCAISFENGELNDYTNQFNKIRGLKLENIESVSRWKKEKKVNKYRIKTLTDGKILFLSDYLVDSKALLNLAELIALEVGKRNAIAN